MTAKRQTYLTEPVLYGGDWSTRAEVIRDLEHNGYTAREIDFYLIGLDRFMESQQSTVPAESEAQP